MPKDWLNTLPGFASLKNVTVSVEPYLEQLKTCEYRMLFHLRGGKFMKMSMANSNYGLFGTIACNHQVGWARGHRGKSDNKLDEAAELVGVEEHSEEYNLVKQFYTALSPFPSRIMEAMRQNDDRMLMEALVYRVDYVEDLVRDNDLYRTVNEVHLVPAGDPFLWTSGSDWWAMLRLAEAYLYFFEFHWEKWPA
jgi:hypothetical protein